MFSRRHLYTKLFFLFMLLGAAAFFIYLQLAPHSLIKLFPLDNYEQNLHAWIKPSDPHYEEPLLTAERQQQHFTILNDHYFGTYSPWNAHYINQILHQSSPNDLLTIEKSILANFNNLHKPAIAVGYGANFRPYSPSWIISIASNVQLSQFEKLSFRAENRAISIDNLHTRSLPTDDVHFYNPKRAGQGYPFDNLQLSSLWAGTPLYVLGESKDHAWSLVLTPELIGWVKSNGLAYTDDAFIKAWTKASQKQLAAITHTGTPVVDENKQFRFLAFIGAIYPAQNTSSGLRIMLAASDADHRAHIRHSILSADTAALMPLAPTPKEFLGLISSLQGRTYSWGGKHFYNDCSTELSSLFKPFGIWLPRHSSDQPYVGKIVDLTAATPEERLSFLMKKGRGFMTTVYIGGHIFVYLGNYQDPNSKKRVALTYQNIWGLRPSSDNRRAVIGKAVILPLLLQYPEDSSLISQAAKKYFQISYLDEAPNNRVKLESIDVRTLMGMG